MHFLNKLSVTVVSALGLSSVVIAVPVESSSSSALVARDPYAVHHGWALSYDPALGACGWSNVDADPVAGIDGALFQEMMVDDDPTHSAACGKDVEVTWKGRSVNVKVVENCPWCGYDNILLSLDSWNELVDWSRWHEFDWSVVEIHLGVGRLSINSSNSLANTLVLSRGVGYFAVKSDDACDWGPLLENAMPNVPTLKTF
ncbi:Rare lipoprotein A-like double-psi beta-barrel protein [Ceratobasidium theobromae]|uniref:Rare lipoprotein A-like double-psi beta-barrel protein n=1 Tax=Ceratobasidium theobromae TaxID=1582974 RepID=A0A5N5QFL2_9AGAM|nr:Rare lipoprotein A-like double-psi beta-barrel protein [Ceratobasidium theobromae]